MNDQGRGIVLTIWLVLLIGGGAVGSVGMFAAYDAVEVLAPGWLLLTLGGLALAKAVGGVVLMVGKRWGLWLNIAANAAALVVCMIDGMPFYTIPLYLVDPTVLYLLMRPTWDRFA